MRGSARQVRGLVVLALALVPAVSHAQAPPTAAADSVTLEPPSPGLGEEAVLRLSSTSVDSASIPPVGVGVDLSEGPEPGTFTVVPIRVGRVGIALPPADGDTLWWEVARSIEQPSPERLRPLKSSGEIGPNWWPTILGGLALLLPPLLWLARRAGRRGRSRPAFAIPEEPAHVVALRRLEEIANSGWLQAQEYDRYFVEASHALRAYIGGRYRVPVLDWTSREVEEGLQRAGYDRETVAAVAPLLREADEVKFAGERPTQHAAEGWLDRAREWILATKVEPRFSTPEALAAAESFGPGGGQ